MQSSAGVFRTPRRLPLGNLGRRCATEHGERSPALAVDVDLGTNSARGVAGAPCGPSGLICVCRVHLACRIEKLLDRSRVHVS
eukprot:3968640-Prorocentrum_lima.AAC.1